MFVLPSNVSQQLVADRRASYEAVAFRRQFRRLLSRGVEATAPSATTVSNHRVGAVVDLRDGVPESVSASKVA
jgi:hypothetical protein